MAYAELTDCRCWYELKGVGPPLMLVPGLGATHDTWSGVIGPLSEHFSVILVDNRGIGQSVAHRPVHRLQHLASDMVELMDHLQIARAHVLGLSLGGMIAQRLAIDHPTRVDRLVLVSCTHRFGPYLREVAQLIGQTLRWFPRPLFERTMQLLGGSPLHIDANPASLDQQVNLSLKRNVGRAAVVQQLRALAASEPGPDEFRIDAPTLVLAGEYDALIPHCYARKMADEIPHSRFELIEGAGHHPLMEDPRRMLPRIIAFLQESGRDRASAGPAAHAEPLRAET